MFLKLKSSRIAVVLVLSLGLLFVFLVQLFSIHFFRSAFLLKLASKQHTYYLELEPKRGGIFDRNMRPMAVNVATFSLYGVPPHVTDRERVVRELHEVLGLDEDFVRERLSRPKQFVWIARKLDWGTMEKVRALGLNGLYFLKESKRSYPHASMASQVLGFAGLDNVGLDGLELKYDSYLKGTPGWTFVLRDARQRDLAI
ncbi:MAG: stage V sporulation protein D, partial [Candidatus Omnitrophica bacterium]|nr:stage V sporulation protein D [Candidatus Omnitrophota bacterium]